MSLLSIHWILVLHGISEPEHGFVVKKNNNKKKSPRYTQRKKVPDKHNFILTYVSSSFVTKSEHKKCSSIVRILKQYKRNIIFRDGRFQRFSEYGVLVKTIPFKYLV